MEEKVAKALQHLQDVNDKRSVKSLVVSLVRAAEFQQKRINELTRDLTIAEGKLKAIDIVRERKDITPAHILEHHKISTHDARDFIAKYA